MEYPTLWAAIKINWARFEMFRHSEEDFHLGADLCWKVRVFRDCQERQRLSSAVREGEAVVKAPTLAEGSTEAVGAGGVLEGKEVIGWG